MLERRVDLPSGGYLMIDYAEALTVIDVNTGSFTGKGKSARLEDTITKTNLEAAEEVVSQLRLRDIGGIIVIDFIDMARARNRDAVLKVLRKALDEDRTKTFVVEISPLGLVEMTRQNVTDGVREIMTKTCPVCDGEGVVKSEETIAIEVARHLRHMVNEAGDGRPRGVPGADQPARHGLVHRRRRARAARAGGARPARYFHFEGSEGLPLDHFAVTMEGSRDGDRGARRAVPRRRGGPRRHRRAAHVQPGRRGRQGRRLPDHVVNGIAFVGEKKLVRIEEAGRTTPRAALTGADAEAAAEAAPRSAPRSARRPTSARKRSAAAKKGAARRKAREAEATEGSPTRARQGGPRGAKSAEAEAAGARRRRRGRAEDQARAARRRAHSGRQAAPRPARRRRGGRRDGATDRRSAPDAGERRARGRGRGAPADEVGRRRRRAILSASAPRPQRRTAPFAREGRADAEVTE